MDERRREPNYTLVTIIGVLAVVGIILFASSVTITKFGTVKLVTQFGGLTGTVFQEGLNFKTPFVQGTVTVPLVVTSYETSDQPEESKANYTDFPITAQTKDGQQITVTYTVLFRIPGDKAVEIARTIGRPNMVVENVIKAHSRNLARILAQGYSAESLYSGIGIKEYEAEVDMALVNAVEYTGVIIDSFLVRKVTFDADYISAVEAKQIAQEGIKTEQYKAEQAEQIKQQSIRAAEADAQRTKLAADAEAYSINVRGEALKNNPNLVQWEFVQQLAGINWMILPDTGVTPLLPVSP